MIGKLFIKFLLGRNKKYSDTIRINGTDYKVDIEPYAPPADADTWVKLLEERRRKRNA